MSLNVVVVSIVAVLFSACSSTPKIAEERQRARPTQILSDCSELRTRLEGREHFFKTLRGEARITSAGESSELALALMSPAYLRAEVSGPLGIRMGLIQINEEWVQFYDARSRRVHRLPFAEFERDSLRRDRYLKVLPVQIPGPFFLDLVLSRTGLDAGLDAKTLRSCEYLKDENVYRLVFVSRSEHSERNRWHRVDVDPNEFFPLLHLTRITPKSELLNQDSPSWANPEWKLLYSKFMGQGTSTLPRLIEVFGRNQALWSFEWVSAETIQDRGPELFLWRPSASMKVQDY